MNKQEKIRQLIELQKKYMEEEKQGRVSMQTYFVPEEDSNLNGYAKKHRDIAMEIIDDAHKEVGSHS